jgi:hypothetical protein
MPHIHEGAGFCLFMTEEKALLAGCHSGHCNQLIDRAEMISPASEESE